MKSSEKAQKLSSPSETQVANRVKKRKFASDSLKSQVSNAKTSGQLSSSPRIPTPKPKVKKFKSLERAKRFNYLKGSLVTGKPVDFEGFPSIFKCFQQFNLASAFIFDKPTY